MTILNVMDRHNRLLLWGRGPHAQAVRRFARRLRQPTLVDAEHTLQRFRRRSIDFEELFAAADEILITATDPVPTYPICLSMAAGLPIVSTVTTTIAVAEPMRARIGMGKAYSELSAVRPWRVVAEAMFR